MKTMTDIINIVRIAFGAKAKIIKKNDGRVVVQPITDSGDELSEKRFNLGVSRSFGHGVSVADVLGSDVQLVRTLDEDVSE